MFFNSNGNVYASKGNNLNKSNFNIANGNGGSSTSKSNQQQTTVSFEVFKDHWKQVLIIFNKSLINDDDIQIVKNNLNQMICLLIEELNQITNLTLKTNKTINYVDNVEINQKLYGPIWDYLLNNNIFETIFLWTLSYPEYLYDLKYEQLKYYEILLNQMQTNEQTNLILFSQLHRPLFSLLNHCGNHNSEIIERQMISILNQLCVCMCKNSNLLNIFFENSSSNSQMFINNNTAELILERTTVYSNEQKFKSVHSSKSFIFTLLIPYIHKEGSFGQQARDALLMIMQLSSRNSNLAKYIVYNTDFCPILATGLSGLYSELPQKLAQTQSIDEIRYLQKEDIISIPSLNKFINSLEFCNNVIQVSHSLIANQLLQYVYYGFLIPVIAPALTQNCIDEIIAATLYLELFLRTINEPSLLKIFLKFVLYSKFDERVTLLDTLINRINLNTKLSLVTLMLFYTMIDLNSEDVMYKLILIYLMPCKHLMRSQIVTLKHSSQEINGMNAQTFLSLSTDFNNPDSNNNNNLNMNSNSDKSNQYLIPTNFSNLNDNSMLYKWLNTMFDVEELNPILMFLDNMHFNFVDYLKDSKNGILSSAQKSLKWSSTYDFVSNFSSSNFNSTRTLDDNHFYSNQPSHELDYDPEEYLFNLNISSGSLNDPTKSARSTMNLFSKENNFENESIVDYDLDSFNSNSINKKDENNKHKLKNSTKNKKSKLINGDGSIKTKGSKRTKRRNRASANDFYILSFDNELSETSSSSSSSDLTDDDDDEGNLEENINEDDEDLTATSVSSSITINNDNSSFNSFAPNQDQSNNLSDAYVTQYRQLIIDYLFSNEENNKLYLNTNLNNFLNALDNFFTNSNTNQKNSIELISSNNNTDLNLICDQILNVYNELFVLNKTETILPNKVIVENKPSIESNQKQPVTSLNMTTFPSYVNDSLSSSTYSINTHNQTFDSGVESTNSTSKENDIGPFLCALLNRLDHMLTNSLQINFLITGIFARLAYYPQLLLRSFLLNHNLVLQPNIKSLIQVLGNVKFKIEACSKTYNNFSLLYLKAKLFLVKRLIDAQKKVSKTKNLEKQLLTEQKLIQPISNNQTLQIPDSEKPKIKKKFSMDKILSIFFKPIAETNGDYSNAPVTNDYKSSSYNQQNNGYITTRMDINTDKIMNGKQIEIIQLREMNGDFGITDNDWDDLRSRNIAYSAVVFDEFVKELAAICQEHCVLTQELY